MAAGWFETRFIADDKKVATACSVCARPMFFPPSKAGKYLTCGAECAQARRNAMRSARERRCETCGDLFCPRPAQIRIGGGRYCSVACAEPARAAGRTPEVAARRGLRHREAFLRGEWTPARGPANAKWRGGREAYMERQRQKDPVQRNAKRRAYLRANPDRAKEWARKRRGAMIVRLPRGTVKKIGNLQRWRCAACSAGIRLRFHVDHMIPLAAGGEHAPLNIQLLCKTCNLRKSAKHPVDFMRQMGKLL